MKYITEPLLSGSHCCTGTGQIRLLDETAHGATAERILWTRHDIAQFGICFLGLEAEQHWRGGILFETIHGLLQRLLQLGLLANIVIRGEQDNFRFRIAGEVSITSSSRKTVSIRISLVDAVETSNPTGATGRPTALIITSPITETAAGTIDQPKRKSNALNMIMAPIDRNAKAMMTFCSGRVSAAGGRSTDRR